MLNNESIVLNYFKNIIINNVYFIGGSYDISLDLDLVHFHLDIGLVFGRYL